MIKTTFYFNGTSLQNSYCYNLYTLKCECYSGSGYAERNMDKPKTLYMKTKNLEAAQGYNLSVK